MLSLLTGKNADPLAPIPGEYGLPMVGTSLKWIKEPMDFPLRCREKYGDVYRTQTFSEKCVVLGHPDWAQYVLRENKENFSVPRGWAPFLKDMFPGGLLQREPVEHRIHRRIFLPAFSKKALEGYIALMNPLICQTLDEWGKDKSFHVYPSVKHMLLTLSAKVFLGIDTPAELNRLVKGFVDMMNATINLIPYSLPGTALRRGFLARAFIEKYIYSLLPQKREEKAPDLLSQMCHATSEEGERFTDKEIVEHMTFLWMASHDTTTSGLTMSLYLLAKHPAWQERLRETFLGLQTPQLDYQGLGTLKEVEWVTQESLRLYPPVYAFPRKAIEDCELGGFHVPAGTLIWVDAMLIHRNHLIWNDPERFDPERFSEERQEHKQHPFAWCPFGGGVHICLGLRFATLQIKSILHQLLLRYEFELPPEYQLKIKAIPMYRPADGLPLRLTHREPSK